MGINHWPVGERPRERLLEQGASVLSDAELLAIFLRTGVKGRSAVDLARDLLAEFGSIGALITAERAQFKQARGLGDAKYAQLKAVLELARRHYAQQLGKGIDLTSPAAVIRYLRAELGDCHQEIFGVVFLDNRHRVIRFERLFYGTIDQATVHPREVIRAVLKYNAAAVILAHNHPSGVAEPSMADKQITQRLKQALDLIEVRLLDHIIVGDPATSFAEQGLL
ncbi:MAG TPA: JAB domain-containing protein [Halothiobacillaceae bacterium]|nr:JAB domain-containing protein [Halothiobacillaceae bacterium]